MTRTTEQRIIDAFHTAGRRRPSNRIALIIAANLHDVANKRGPRSSCAPVNSVATWSAFDSPKSRPWQATVTSRRPRKHKPVQTLCQIL